MNKTLILSLSFMFSLTCSFGVARWVHLLITDDVSCHSDNGFLVQKSMTVMGYHCSKYCTTFHLLTTNLEKHLVLQGTHLQYLIHLSTTWHFAFLFTASQYRSKIFTQVFFNFLYIGFIISIIDVPMMSTNIAIAFVTLIKTLVTITKIWTSISRLQPSSVSVPCAVPQVLKCPATALKCML